MREHIYDGAGGPFDRAPDPPDDCVICGAPLSDDNDAGEVPDHGDGGWTCSHACAEAHLVRLRAERRADAEASADRAAAEHSGLEEGR